MPASNETLARVTKVLMHALGVEEDDIKPSATLQGDLGAESIDFLDIMFRLDASLGSRSRVASCSLTRPPRMLRLSCARGD